jgi:hypothetical protein
MGYAFLPKQKLKVVVLRQLEVKDISDCCLHALLHHRLALATFPVLLLLSPCFQKAVRRLSPL